MDIPPELYRTTGTRNVVTWLVFIAACYASHEPQHDGGASTSDASALPRDVGSADAGVCEDLPGGSECGCVGEYRRCDTCDVPCPEGQRCWRSVGVCRPPDAFAPEGAPIHDMCVLWPGVSASVLMNYCASGQPCAVSAEVARNNDGVGPCMSEAFCLAAPEATPPLPQEVVCIGSSGLEWRPAPPGGDCPDPRFCGGACGACERFGLAAESCVGIDATRPFGLCAITSAGCTENPLRVSEDSALPPGLSCLLLEPRAEGLGWLVDPDDCRAYADRYDGVRCRRGTVPR